VSPTDLMPAKEVAEIFGVTPHTVLRWVKEGRLRSVETLDGRRFLPSDVADLLHTLELAEH
jgi:excisionase family DNA binding protein